jgi:hypothetical protein
MPLVRKNQVFTSKLYTYQKLFTFESQMALWKKNNSKKNGKKSLTTFLEFGSE